MKNTALPSLPELIAPEMCRIWNSLTTEIDSLYDMEKTWSKGFGSWEIEYKYRRGGKTLCTFYAKKDSAVILFTLGKVEREKFDGLRDSFSAWLVTLYDSTHTYHDGKWLWIPLDDTLFIEDIRLLLRIKRRPNRPDTSKKSLMT